MRTQRRGLVGETLIVRPPLAGLSSRTRPAGRARHGTILARAVLVGATTGYRHHPQLDRFRRRREEQARALIEEAAEIALRTVLAFLDDEAAVVEEVVFVLYDADTYSVYRDALARLG